MELVEKRSNILTTYRSISPRCLQVHIDLNEILLAIYHQRLSKPIQEYLIYLKQGWTLAGIYMTSSDPASKTSIPRNIERSDAVVEASILGSPDVKSQLIGKDTDAGKDWRQKKKGAAEDEMIK